MTGTHQEHEDHTLRKAARGLREEWDSPALWPAIERQMRAAARPAWRWQPLAAAAALLIASGTGWLLWSVLTRPAASGGAAPAAEARLLSDEAYADVERAEAQYTRAIDELSKLVAPKLEMPDSDLLISLRDRLRTIDAAIAESREQIDRNPFNAQLRRQLLFIYQEKRRTLEQIQDHDDTTL